MSIEKAISDLELERLGDVAHAATGARWSVEGGFASSRIVGSDEVIAADLTMENAAHVAAFDPCVAGQLVNELQLRRLERWEPRTPERVDVGIWRLEFDGQQHWVADSGIGLQVDAGPAGMMDLDVPWGAFCLLWSHLQQPPRPAGTVGVWRDRAGEWEVGTDNLLLFRPVMHRTQRAGVFFTELLVALPNRLIEVVHALLCELYEEGSLRIRSASHG